MSTFEYIEINSIVRLLNFYCREIKLNPLSYGFDHLKVGVLRGRSVIFLGFGSNTKHFICDSSHSYGEPSRVGEPSSDYED